MAINNQSESILKKRIRKFKSTKRGYYSLIILISMYIFSWLAPLFINNNALIVKHNDKFYFPFINEIINDNEWISPIFKLENYNSQSFGEESTTSYRLLKNEFKQQNNKNYVIMPIYPYGPLESDALYELDDILTLDVNNNGEYDKETDKYIDYNNSGIYDKFVNPATLPFWYWGDSPAGKDTKSASHKLTSHLLGTDNQGRDIFARIVYGFRISMTFALIVWALSYSIGIIVGGTIGYIGGKLDLLGFRIIEIYSSIPFLFLLMILANFIQPDIFILAAMYVFLTGWIGISWYIRGEFLREKSKDYVSAAVSMGQNHRKIIFKHILPNALTPIVTNAPFAIIGYISGLVSLDYLGFGLQPPTPSWGELLKSGSSNLDYWNLVIFPLIILGITLFLITLIGEAVRAAFDPKVHSRLR